MESSTSRPVVRYEDVTPALIGFQDLLRGTHELNVINEGTEYTQHITAARQAQLEHIRNDLHALQKTLEVSKEAATRPNNVPKPAQHAQMLETLEQARYAAAKATRDGEVELQTKTAIVAKLKEDLEAWDRRDPLEEHQVDSFALRAQIWKSMGFELRRGRDGGPDKMLITTESGDMRVLPLDSEPNPTETPKLWKINAS